MRSGVGWERLADGLRAAGRSLDESIANLDPAERADGHRALMRALNNLLARFEVDPDSPELVAFNGWRQKFFMDNPDYRYWITDIRADGGYRISGNVGQSVYQSITVYAGTGAANASAVARIDTDGLGADPDGNFDLVLSRDVAPPAGLELPADATSVWVRYVHDAADPPLPGWCRIERLTAPTAAPALDPGQLERDLSRLGAFMSQLPQVMAISVADDEAAPNTVRHWTAMSGGAAFTEPGIHYLRGGWRLDPDEALVVEGPLPACRHWNMVLYSRFLNSLDYRHRRISLTAASSTAGDRHFRVVLAGRDPGLAGYDWLDTEGREFGLFVIRVLQPAGEPELPTIRRARLDGSGIGR